jgi:hypothetical protein
MRHVCRRRVRWAGALSLALALTLATPAAAQPVFAVATVTGQQRLVQFDTQTPGTIDSSVVISGLQGAEVVRAIDFLLGFPSDTLYALGSTSRLYTIESSTGAATQVGSGPFTPALSGTSFGFEAHFDGYARVVSDADQNLRLDLGTGMATADGNLAYEAGDPNFGANPNVVGAALRGETLYEIDSVLDVLAIQQFPGDPPDDNGLTTVGPLGLDSGPVVGFDVSGGGNPYAVLDIGGVSKLYLIDLDTGAATLRGTVGGSAITGGLALPSSTPQLSATPSPFDFGTQPVGTMGPAKSVTVTLVGGDALADFIPYITGAHYDDFFLTANLCQPGPESGSETPLLKLPGDSCTLRIRFAPSAEGTRSAIFRFGEPKCCPTGSFLDIPLTGSGTSGPFGPVGPQGAPGATGPQGSQGPQGRAGRDAVVRCRVTRTRSTRRVKVRCRVTRASGRAVRATLYRRGRAYASGRTPTTMRALRRVRAGRYTLAETRRVGRRLVTERQPANVR